MACTRVQFIRTVIWLARSGFHSSRCFSRGLRCDQLMPEIYLQAGAVILSWQPHQHLQQKGPAPSQGAPLDCSLGWNGMRFYTIIFKLTLLSWEMNFCRTRKQRTSTVTYNCTHADTQTNAYTQTLTHTLTHTYTQMHTYIQVAVPCAISACCHSVLGSLLAAYWRDRTPPEGLAAAQ